MHCRGRNLHDYQHDGAIFLFWLWHHLPQVDLMFVIIWAYIVAVVLSAFPGRYLRIYLQPCCDCWFSSLGNGRPHRWRGWALTAGLAHLGVQNLRASKRKLLAHNKAPSTAIPATPQHCPHRCFQVPITAPMPKAPCSNVAV